MTTASTIRLLPVAAMPLTAETLAEVRADAVAVLRKLFSVEAEVGDDYVVETCADIDKADRQLSAGHFPGLAELLGVADKLDQLHVFARQMDDAHSRMSRYPSDYEEQALRKFEASRYRPVIP